MTYIDPEDLEMGCVLYDSFEFKCGFDDQYGSFGGGIYVGPQGLVINPLGRGLLTSSNEEAIRKKLQIVDDYCRLRLPDKFLEAYDRAYKNKE